MAWKSIITNAGLGLLKSMLGGSRLTITRAEIGSDVLTDEEIKELSVLGSKIPAYVEVVKIPDINGYQTMQVRISNYGVTEATVMHQVGIYANTSGAGEVLLAVCQNNFGEEIPTYAEYPNLLLKFNAGLDISVTDNITVVVNQDAFTTFDDLKAHNENPNAHLNIISKSVEVSRNPTPAVGVKTHYYVLKSVSGYVTPYEPPELAGVEVGVLDTGAGKTAGFVADDTDIHPMAILTE